MPSQSQKYVGSILAFGSGGNIPQGQTRYLAATGGTANPAEVVIIMTRGGKLKNLRWASAPSGLTGAPHTIIVFVNGVATPLSDTWNAGGQAGVNTTVQVSVSTGDRVSVRVKTASGGTSIPRLQASIELEMDSTSRWLADDPDDPDSNVYYSGNGNVGIGTDSPQAKLNVAGDLQVLAGPPITEFSTDQTFADNSDSAVPTERAVRQYVEALLTGSVSAFAMQTPPLGWVECNGQILDRTIFPRLFGRIGTAFGGVPTGGFAQVSAYAVIGADLFAGTNCGVYRSSDNGTSWTSVNNGLLSSVVLSLAVLGTDLFAGTNSGVYRSSDNGASWVSVNTGLTFPVVLSLATIGSDLFIGTGVNATKPGESCFVFRTSDRGASWLMAGQPGTAVGSLAVIGTDLFAGTIGGVFRSSDYGASWISVKSGLTPDVANSLAVVGTDLFAGTDVGGVFRSSDNGASWVPAYNGPGIAYIRSLATSGGDLFAGTRISPATGSSGVFHSSDSGASWSSIGTFATDVVSFTAVGTDLFASTLDGVFRSSDNGTSWTQVNNGLTDGFRVPDLRGEFIRGWDDGRGIDKGRGCGQWQGDLLVDHHHRLGVRDALNLGGGKGQLLADYTGVDDPGMPSSLVPSGPALNESSVAVGNENRPRNVALMYCIKV